MELIIIDEKKMKIMLTAPDLRHYELRAERMDCADEQTRRAFRHIFDDARSQTGFDTTGERLFVQLYTSKSGGCEIFVTKLGEPDADNPVGHTDRSAVSLSATADGQTDAPNATPSACLSPSEKALMRRVLAADRDEEVRDMRFGSALHSSAISTVADSPSLPVPATHMTAFRFSGLDPLLRVCRRLRSIHYRGDSAAYIETYNGEERWYLCLEVPDTPSDRLPTRLAFLHEYGREIERFIGDLTLHLTEHGRTVCPTKAVEVLGEL